MNTVGNKNMTILRKHTFMAAALGASLLFGAQAHAQSSQDMSLLSQEEHAAFNKRLQKTASSAERAKITAEMNRIVQERRLDLRLKKKQGQK